MSRIAYVDGRYLRLGAAAVPVEDRGLQLGDSVYEVCEVFAGALVDSGRHLDRLERSLASLEIAPPLPRPALLAVAREVVTRNRVRDGLVYLQVTRGTATRDHAFPARSRPRLLVTARAFDRGAVEARAARGVAVVTMPDTRWARVDIKTTNLLPNVLAKQAARRAGAWEAWFVGGDGYVTEGASTNAWIVTAAGVAVTRPADHAILRGITRDVVMTACAAEGIGFAERPFTVAEAHGAREAFYTASTAGVMPVVTIDGRLIGDGEPGPLARRLRVLYRRYSETGTPNPA